MKKAINQWCFPAQWSWERVFALCERAGFEAIELCIDYEPFFEVMRQAPPDGIIAEIAKSVGSELATSKSLTFDSRPQDLRRVASLGRDHGVSVSSLLTIAQFHFSLIADDEHLRSTGVDLVKRLLDFAVELEAPSLLIVPGVISARTAYEDAYRRFDESIGILKQEAEARKVELGIENVWGKFLYSPLEMRDFVDRFKSPSLGVHFDVGNVMQYGYPDQWIRTLGDRLLNIHVKDFREDIGNIRGFTHLFQGDVPWDRVMSALRDVGYEGYLIAEVPPYPFHPEEGIWDISRKLDILLGLTAGPESRTLNET